jgi:hypothetical protein
VTVSSAGVRFCESVSPSRYSGDVATAIIGPAGAGPYRILRLAYAPRRLHSVAGYTEFLSLEHFSPAGAFT